MVAASHPEVYFDIGIALSLKLAAWVWMWIKCVDVDDANFSLIQYKPIEEGIRVFCFSWNAGKIRQK